MGSLFYIVTQGWTLLATSSNLKHAAYAVEGIVYRGYRKDMLDEDTFLRLSQIFNGAAQGKSWICLHLSVPPLTLPESTFDTLKSGLPLRWEQSYDTTNPYGDRREALFETVWTFELDEDILVYTKKNRSGHVPLSALRQRQVTFADFVAREPPTAPILDVQEVFVPPYWEPTLQVQERNKTFTRRVLDDFDFQWRHVLRSRYNDLTFRKLVCGVVRILRLDFRVVEFTKSRPVLGGYLVGVLDLPEWEPLPMQTVRLGRVWLTASQNPAASIPLIREHLETRQDKGLVRADSVYLILSLRHVILCRGNRDRLEWTRPEPFLNGTSSYSDRALDLLLWAVSPDPPRTSLHQLPVEIQDRILRHVSQGPIEAARVGCALGLGSLFLWKDGEMRIDLERVQTGRNPFSPVESQIWFDDHMSGISYKGNVRSLKSPYTVV